MATKLRHILLLPSAAVLPGLASIFASTNLYVSVYVAMCRPSSLSFLPPLCESCPDNYGSWLLNTLLVQCSVLVQCAHIQLGKGRQRTSHAACQL